METKKMTLAEAQELVKNTKYLVWSEDESMVLQNKLLEIGCEWRDSGKRVCNTEYPFLYVNDALMITCERNVHYSCFESDSKKYKQTDDILNIELKQSKPKFDANTLKPFDKVLVRDTEKQTWRAKFFHCKKGEQFYTIDDVIYQNCIPYNDETKHLLGTREDSPEFYKLD